MRPVFKIIIAYEVFFFLFWQVLYNSNQEIENWFESQILEAIYTILSTMAIGFVLVYVVYISAKLSGFLDKVKKIKDPRKNS